jgi:hypothetical protein
MVVGSCGSGFEMVKGGETISKRTGLFSGLPYKFTMLRILHVDKNHKEAHK